MFEVDNGYVKVCLECPEKGRIELSYDIMCANPDILGSIVFDDSLTEHQNYTIFGSQEEDKAIVVMDGVETDITEEVAKVVHETSLLSILMGDKYDQK